MKNHVLHLANQADRWENATPIGCGNLGASIYGTTACERVQFNEEWLWAGHHLDLDSPELGEKLYKIRQMLLDGENDKADKWASDNIKGLFGFIDSFETAGELYISQHRSGECENYARDLDLDHGIASVCYDRAGVSFRREFFASYPKNLIGIRYTNENGAKYDLDVTYSRPRIKHELVENEETGILSKTVEGGDTLVIKGQTDDGEHEFVVKVKIQLCGGTLCFDNEANAVIRGADSVAFFVTIATLGSSRRPQISLIGTLDYEALRDESAADVFAMMSRSDIEIDDEYGNEDIAALPVNRRLALLKEHTEGYSDNSLASLYFAFGKYLLVSSSRPGTLPANLQGVWCDAVDAPWNSDYHTNINLQMNYWPAETANIGECTEALFTYMNDALLPSGRKTAEVSYGCRGTVLHHVSDPYGFTGPADGVWGLWPMGAAWLSYHLWDHYLFTGDLDFLRKVAYPYIEASTQFFLDFTFEHDGMLLSGPSASPENMYMYKGHETSICLSPTMDVEIIGGLWQFYVETEKLLGINPEQCAEVEAALKKLPPLKIGKFGQLCEWLEDYDEVDPGHRHVSHAFGLYPGYTITKEKTPEIFEGVRAALARRLAHGGGHTGWSAAWLINLHAHLHDGVGAAGALRKLFTQSTMDNLYDKHPPFQIDGNFGGCAAIAEMVMQSRDDIIRILPAAAPEWTSGRFSGLMARGGWEISCRWKDGKVESIGIIAHNAGKQTIKVEGREIEVELAAGEKKTLEF